MTSHPIFTIGHSNHSLEDFLALLSKHRVTAVADVRSAPWSRFNPHFNRNALFAALEARGVRSYTSGASSAGARTIPPCTTKAVMFAMNGSRKPASSRTVSHGSRAGPRTIALRSCARRKNRWTPPDASRRAGTRRRRDCGDAHPRRWRDRTSCGDDGSVARFVPFARQDHRLRPPFAPPETGALPEDPDHFARRPRRVSGDGEDETSQVWATLAHMPRSQTPAVRRPLTHSGPALVSSAQPTASTPQEFTSGAPSRGLRAPCVRFAAGVTPAPRNTRFRPGASLGRSGLSPAGSHRRFPPCLSFYMPSPFTRLRLAQRLHKMSYA